MICDGNIKSPHGLSFIHLLFPYCEYWKTEWPVLTMAMCAIGLHGFFSLLFYCLFLTCFCPHVPWSVTHRRALISPQIDRTRMSKEQLQGHLPMPKLPVTPGHRNRLGRNFQVRRGRLSLTQVSDQTYQHMKYRTLKKKDIPNKDLSSLSVKYIFPSFLIPSFLPFFHINGS